MDPNRYFLTVWNFTIDNQEPPACADRSGHLFSQATILLDFAWQLHVLPMGSKVRTFRTPEDSSTRAFGRAS